MLSIFVVGGIIEVKEQSVTTGSHSTMFYFFFESGSKTGKGKMYTVAMALNYYGALLHVHNVYKVH